jgi:signal transduction histidine kinase
MPKQSGKPDPSSDDDIVLDRLRRQLQFLGLTHTRAELDAHLAWATHEQPGVTVLLEHVFAAEVGHKLELCPLDLVSVLRAAVEIVTPAAMAKEIALDVDLPALPLALHGDADRLQQVAWNLLSNAIKFTPQGGRVEMRLSCLRSAVELQVQDTGCGITVSFLHVFERFRQAEASPGRGAGGLGLGLSIVQYLVEVHGGAVKAESAGEGRGATFTVVLPLPSEPARSAA